MPAHDAHTFELRHALFIKLQQLPQPLVYGVVVYTLPKCFVDSRVELVVGKVLVNRQIPATVVYFVCFHQLFPGVEPPSEWVVGQPAVGWRVNLRPELAQLQLFFQSSSRNPRKPYY